VPPTPASTELAWAALDTPVGRLSVGCSPAGLSQVRFGPAPRQAASAQSGPATTAPEPTAPAPTAPAPTAPAPTAPAPTAPGPTAPGAAGDLTGAALAQLGEYFAGRRRRFDLPVDWAAMSRLQRQVLEVLFDSVGYGQTVSYGTLARRSGLDGDAASLPARAVGRIMGSNPIPVVVPCHRVVASDGLGGYSGGTGPEVKHWLLVFEGALPPTLDWDPARLRA
jgi:methylated-DNA-[protein]-cysteine S-methyltransferase